MMIINSSSHATINNVNHPMEDYLIEDKEKKIFIVVDGITRIRSEYEELKESTSFKIAKEFADMLHEILSVQVKKIDSVSKGVSILKESFNQAVKYINDIRDNIFYTGIERPGCVGVVGIIYNDTFIYGGFGDSGIFLTRENQTLILFASQTEYAFKKIKVEADRERLYREFVNIPGVDTGYGVVNGDLGVDYFFNPSYIDLKPNDFVYLSSDGVAEYLRFTRPEVLNQETVKEIIEFSRIYDNAFNNKRQDDKSLIVIEAK